MRKKRDLASGLGITPLAGARISVFMRVTFKFGIESKYFFKWLLSGVVSFIVTIFSIFDRFVYAFTPSPKELKPPVFIIGHWRSGTTLLHNLMCLDPESGYTTTFQSVFPNNMFAFKWLFKGIMKILTPENRPVDNVRLDVNYPQEEEFALTNETHVGFYNWWYFPKKTKQIADEYLLQKKSNVSEWRLWKKNYSRFVNRSLINTKGKRLISKNPPHTARIPQLLELFPNAKFVYIHRNPYEVIQSTHAFYQGVLPTTQLQDISSEVLLDDILYVYDGLIEKYSKDKALIPKESLVELNYVDLVTRPELEIEKLYKNLLSDDFSRMEKPLSSYVSKQKHGLKERKFKNEFIERVNKKISGTISLQGYKVLSTEP